MYMYLITIKKILQPRKSKLKGKKKSAEHVLFLLVLTYFSKYT